MTLILNSGAKLKIINGIFCEVSKYGIVALPFKKILNSEEIKEIK